MRKNTYLIFVLSVLTLSSCFYRGNHKPLIGGIREYREARLPADDYSINTRQSINTQQSVNTHHPPFNTQHP